MNKVVKFCRNPHMASSRRVRAFIADLDLNTVVNFRSSPKNVQTTERVPLGPVE